MSRDKRDNVTSCENVFKFSVSLKFLIVEKLKFKGNNQSGFVRVANKPETQFL